MIEIGFSIILGFAIVSTLCGVMGDGSRGDRILMRAMVYAIVLACVVMMSKGGATSPFWFISYARELVIMSFIERIAWVTFGASLALIVQLIAEGHIHNLWIRLHPQSAPTPEAGFGKRALPAGRTKPVSATLVGTSTEFLNSELDLRTDTLIRLCYYAFEDRSALMLSRLEAGLRLGTGRRQKSFHQLAAGLRKRPNLKFTLHRYCRSVNGSSRMYQGLFRDLCQLARETQNRDRATVGRLTQTGQALGLHADEIGRLIMGSR